MGLINLIFLGYVPTDSPIFKRSALLKSGHLSIKDRAGRRWHVRRGHAVAYLRHCIVPQLDNHDFGTYRIDFWDTPYRADVQARGRPHPHIDSDGVICFGSADNVVRELLSERDIESAMGTVEQVLHTYSPGYEYAGWWRFKAATIVCRNCGSHWDAAVDIYACSGCGREFCTSCMEKEDGLIVCFRDGLRFCRACIETCRHGPGEIKDGRCTCEDATGYWCRRSG